MSSPHLILRNNQLYTIRIIRIRDRMSQQTNRTNDFPDTMDLAGEVRGIADDGFGFCCLAVGFDADCYAIFVDYFFDFFVEHVGSAEDCGESEVS